MTTEAIGPVRPRRLRLHPLLREIVGGAPLRPQDLIQPIFVRLGRDVRLPIASMPGQYQYSPDTAVAYLAKAAEKGLGACLLFGVTDAAAKDATGSHAHDPENAVCQTLRGIRHRGLPLLAMTDLCYCEYTSHGHCGPMAAGNAGQQTVDNDATVRQLAVQALVHARAGADLVAPSGMMDGAVGAIRRALDAEGFANLPVVSYAVKYASAFYGPFRDAAESPPQFGDRKSYQMDFRRGAQEAIREARLDAEQGADMLIIKPGLPYLDILAAVSQQVPLPSISYHVSGEYAMVKAAAAAGWLDERAIVLESMAAMKRAGASAIITYYATDLLDWIKQ